MASMISDVAYLGPDRSERLDLYLPADDRQRRAAVIIVHGGGWVQGDKASPREIGIAQTLTVAGYVCASVNYLLAAPDRPSWPVCLEDCRAAVRYLRTHATEYRIDPARIGAIGGSAGGCLALLLGLPDAGPGPVSARVQAVVALYAPTDLVACRRDRVHLFGVSKHVDSEPHRAASILHRLPADFPPTLLLHGAADKVVDLSQSQSLAAAMKTLGIPHQLIIVEGSGHTFPLHDGHHDLRPEVVSFFDAHLAALAMDSAMAAGGTGKA